MDLSEEYVKFLDSRPEYFDQVVSLARRGDRSFHTDWSDIYDFSAELGAGLIEEPDKHLKALQEVVHDKYKDYTVEQVASGDIHVRLRGSPNLMDLREIGGVHVSTFVSVVGIVVSAGQILPLIVTAACKCDECGAITIDPQFGQFLHHPKKCNECGNRSLTLDLKQSEYIDVQYLRVQESPEQLPPGQLPIGLRVELQNDLVGEISPGDRVRVSGVLRTMQKPQSASRVLDRYLEAVYIEPISKGTEALELTPADEEEVRKLASDPLIDHHILQSIAPSIYGHTNIKEAISYLLFGGVAKELPDVRIKGDINVLLVGDPGTGKSQLLQYATQASPRGILTTGRGSTAAGLTAAVVKDPQGGMTLEAGALVLADMGLCCIDELEKMDEDDRGAIHPAMEQQIVSVAKGGIVAQLNARCAILAAANPILGRFNEYQNVAENLGNLPVTLLTRFDLIFVVKDPPDRARDEEISNHVLALHREELQKSPIDPKLLRKYISYAKRLKPRLTEEASDRLRDFYLDMRSKSGDLGGGSPIAITIRQLESLVRISEARARQHLREEVTSEDAGAAIALMQRSLEQVGIDTATGQIDIDILYSGKPKSLQDKLQKVLGVISAMTKGPDSVKDEDLFKALEEDNGIRRPEAVKFVGVLMRDGTIFSPRPGFYRRAG